ncbi:MAG: ribosomal protein L13e [Candidatus Atribacteria bacterium]|nr:ribosomal protein L13e [Candidatus Atribacteria bacterium]
MRAGRGFSRQELHQSGIRPCDARRLCVPLDKRRKSAHALNADVLRQLLSEGGKDSDKAD